jgi:ppGpp synthetase/RelA/SpoT-type nucleotidyltranferase
VKSHAYSGKEVTKAGKALVDLKTYRDGELFNWSFDVLSYWRIEHNDALLSAYDLLRGEAATIDRQAIFAKRLKRHPSIVTKLENQPGMTLRNMQDIGGCRAILTTEKKLTKLVRVLRRHKSFRSVGDAEVKVSNYLYEPKITGYRGYHIIGCFAGASGKPRKIEVQLRTRVQHSWATAVEIVDLFTHQGLKAGRGEPEWREFFFAAGEQFSFLEKTPRFGLIDPEEMMKALIGRFDRAMRIDDRPVLDSNDILVDLVERLSVKKKLAVYAHSLQHISEQLDSREVNGYVLLKIDTRNGLLESTIFKREQVVDAERQYAADEKRYSEDKDISIALVSTTAVGGLREAYPNYFADSTEFIRYLTYLEALNRRLNPSFFERIFG